MATVPPSAPAGPADAEAGTYAVVTFGCRVNAADTQALESALLARGARRTDPERAALVLVNTCSVTAAADQGARQTIRRLHRLNPASRVVVTGCYASRSPGELADLPGVVRIVSNDEKDELAAIAADLLELSTADRFGDGDGPCGAMVPGHGGRTVLTLRVQTGCEEACSYCIIPTTRGASRSVPLAAVLNSVDAAVRQGYREVGLTGVHLGAYGRDLTPPASLATLLTALARHGAPVGFRVSSLEPMDCTPEVLDIVASGPPFAPHLHLPLQHASDRVLAAMRRPYTLAQYAEILACARASMPAAALGADVIVGFPGEEDEDVERLCVFLAEAPLTHLHVFPYSDRPGTAASRLANKVHGARVRDRLARVRDVARRKLDAFHAAQVGAVLSGLTIDDGSVVLTGNYCKVRVEPGLARNERVSVLVTSAEPRGQVLNLDILPFGRRPAERRASSDRA